MSHSHQIKIFRVILVGRAGNHTWQLLNAIDFLIEHHDEQGGFELITPSPFFGNRRRFLFPNNKTPMVPITKSTQILVEREAKNFFSYKRTHGGWSGSQLWIQYISPYSIFTPQNTELENLATQRKTLTIHFRSGDIFQGNGAHGKYFQPPLKYYRDIISGGTDSGEPWSAIILMSEDTNNPVQNALLQTLTETPIDGPIVRVIGRPLVEDIGVLMVASHCVYGFGTFWRVPQYSRMGRPCGTVRQIMQFPDYYAGKDFNGADEDFLRNTRVIPLPGYRDAGGDWRNTPEQRALMVNWGYT